MEKAELQDAVKKKKITLVPFQDLRTRGQVRRLHGERCEERRVLPRRSSPERFVFMYTQEVGGFLSEHEILTCYGKSEVNYILTIKAFPLHTPLI